MKQMRLDEKSLVKLEDLVYSLVETFGSPTRKVEIRNILETVGWRYFKSPASHTTSHYNCFEGGLAEHSIRVTKILNDLNQSYSGNISQDTILLVGLFHDIGKIGRVDLLEPGSRDLNDFLFHIQTSEWHKDKLGQYFVLNDPVAKMRYSTRSIQILTQFNIKLSDIEFQMIDSITGTVESTMQASHSGNLQIALFQMARILSIELEKERYNKWLQKIS